MGKYKYKAVSYTDDSKTKKIKAAQQFITGLKIFSFNVSF